MGIVSRQHLTKRRRLAIFLHARLGPTVVFFLFLLGLPQRAPRHAGDHHDDYQRRRQTDVFQGLLIKIRGGRLRFEGIARGGADINQKKHRRQHAEQIRQHVSNYAHSREAEKVIQQDKGKDRAQPTQQNHFETLAADRFVEKTKFGIGLRPAGDPLTEKSTRQEKRAERAEIGADQNDQQTGLKTEQRAGAHRHEAGREQGNRERHVRQRINHWPDSAESLHVGFKDTEPLAQGQEKKTDTGGDDQQYESDGFAGRHISRYARRSCQRQ